MLDLNEISEQILEQAKRNLRNDGILHPMGFTVAMDGKVTPYNLDFETETAKEASCRNLGVTAERVGAVAVMMIADGVILDAQGPNPEVAMQTIEKAIKEHIPPDQIPGHRHGLVLNVSVPGAEAMIVFTKYMRHGKEFIFEPTQVRSSKTAVTPMPIMSGELFRRDKEQFQ